MRSRFSARLGWPLCFLGLATTAAVGALDILVRSRIDSIDAAQPIAIVLGLTFSTLGAIIVVRQAGNRIGWIFLLIGVLTPLQSLANLYDVRAALSGGLPGARWAAWSGQWLTFLVYPTGLSLFVFLLFPGGQLASRRWRAVAWLAVGLAGAGIALTALNPTPITVMPGLKRVANPTGVAAFRSHLLSGILPEGVFLAGTALLAVAIGGLVARSRTGSLRERQQVKILAYAAAVTIALLIVVTLASIAGEPISNTYWDLPIVLGFGVAVPAACTLAILRHGLYEIDRLISRSVAYAIVTGLLAALFLGLVGLATRVLPFSSPIAVAASTLAAAALFNPLRQHVQRLVDRRFNRSRYDAQQTVAEFSTRLRDAIDIETIRAELVETIEEAVAPAHASVWIRPAG